MKGMISPIHARSQGPSFYRMMSIVGLAGTIVFGLIAYVLVDNSKEIIIDRLIVIAWAYYCLRLTHRKDLRRKQIYSKVNLLFYLYMAQVIFAAALNQFQPFYLIVLAISVQSISVAFKTTSQTNYFIVYTWILLFLGLALNPNLPVTAKLYIVTAAILSSILVIILVYFKVQFLRENRIKEDLLRTIVSRTEDGIILTDFEGNMLEANQRAIEMTGYELVELVGMNFSEIRECELTEDQDAAGVRQLLRNKFWNDEVELKRSDKTTFMGFVSISWINRFGQEYLLYKVSDISERKEFEKQLIKAKEHAEAAASAKAEFLATMSHEIRTPMNGVIGMTNVLLNTSLDDDQKRYIETIRRSGESLLVILNDVLDFSKVESGKLRMENHEFSISVLIREVVELLETAATEKGIKLKTLIEKDIPEIFFGDSVRVRQILLNLVGNGIKFTDEGAVIIRCHKQNEQGMVMVEVEDTGIGIPESKASSLFQSFTQVDSSSTRKYGGTGLGLAISKQLVELMGGEIGMKSQLGQGSVFYFCIPVGEPDSTTDYEDNNINIKRGVEINQAAFACLNVLLAEDNIVNQ